MIVNVDGISKKYDKLIFDQFSLRVMADEIVCLLGPSGCGKTTLLNAIAGLSAIAGGKIDVRAAHIGYVFQEDRLLPWQTVYDNIAFVNRVAPREQILALIEKMGLAGYAEHYPSQLSGGMRQRCAIARAFNYSAELLLMDEPFKSLDYSLRFKMVAQLIDMWRSYRHAIVYVTHDIDEALLLADRIIIMAGQPAQVVDTFEVATARQQRQLAMPQLVQLRTKIIDYLMT